MAFAYRPEDRDLAGDVERLLASHDVRMVTGERLGGHVITPAVQSKIAQSDGLVALLTRRDELASGGWTTHQWVQDELASARNMGKPAIAFIEEGVEVGGAYAGHEHIPYDRDDPLPAFLHLSDTVAEWRRAIGKTLKIQILPEEVASVAGESDGDCECRFRLFQRGAFSPWDEVTPVPEAGGTFVYVPGTTDEHLVQMRVEKGADKWESPATAQWTYVRLRRREG